jgi:ATP-binding cassette subfamily B protein
MILIIAAIALLFVQAACDLSLPDYMSSYLAKYCDQNEITLNMLPVLQSKFLLFDLSKQLLYIDNSDKKAIDIKKIEASTTSLTNNDEQNNIIKSH